MVDTLDAFQPSQAYMPPDLSTCTHVYFRHDAVQKPLQPPSIGPYRILERHDRQTLPARSLRSKHNVKIDRLKVAYLNADVERYNFYNNNHSHHFSIIERFIITRLQGGGPL